MRVKCFEGHERRRKGGRASGRDWSRYERNTPRNPGRQGIRGEEREQTPMSSAGAEEWSRSLGYTTSSAEDQSARTLVAVYGIVK